jgi:SRSO17 transposase
MTEQDLLDLKPELERFLEEYAPLFGRPENHEHARLFVQGLFDGSDRRNAENIAEAMAGGNARNLQAFITTGAWQGNDVLERMRTDVIAALADPDGLWNADETGFAKKGDKSVGVQRQYSGTLGRVDNCQIGVFSNYSSVKGHTMLDRRLYLPKEWAADAARRKEAGVPDEVVFRTKPELALEMLSEACAAGIPIRWVGGDTVYGDSPVFVAGVRQLAKEYVLDTACDTHVWTEEPKVVAAEDRPWSGRGPRPSKPEVVGQTRQVDEVIAALPKSAWKRVLIAEGSKGPRLYDYAEVWVWFKEDELPGPRERLLARRSIGQEPELKYHRSNAAEAVPLEKLAQVRGRRWTIEEDIQSAKGECGLDEYETRKWSGWHHHTALSLLALAFLVLQRIRLGEKRGAEQRSGGAAAERARGAGAASTSPRRASVEQSGDPALVGLAAGEKPTSCRQPSQAAVRGTEDDHRAKKRNPGAAA